MRLLGRIDPASTRPPLAAPSELLGAQARHHGGSRNIRRGRKAPRRVLSGTSLAAPLAALLSDVAVDADVLSFSFNEGRQTIRADASKGIHSTFRFVTDGAGSIVSWEILMQRPFPLAPGRLPASIHTGAIIGQDDALFGTSDSASVPGSPGTRSLIPERPPPEYCMARGWLGSQFGERACRTASAHPPRSTHLRPAR